MSSIVNADYSGDQVFLDRDNWFSAESIRMLEEACDDPKVGPERCLAMILHHGLGLPLSLVSRLLKTTKNTVAKQVISGKRRVKKREVRVRAETRQSTLF